MEGVPGELIANMIGVTEISDQGNSDTNQNGINVINSDSDNSVIARIVLLEAEA